MKILITTDVYDSIINGVAVSISNLITGLTAQGHEVKVLTLSKDIKSHKQDNIYYVSSFPLKIYPDARATFSFNHEFIKELEAWKPDIIHSQCEFFSFMFAKKLAVHLNIPIAHTYHTLYEYYTHYFIPSKKLGKKVVSKGTRLICNHVDSVIAPTEKTASILRSYDINVPISTIPTGISLKHLQKEVTASEIQILKSRYNIPADSTVLLTIGRVAKEKNIEELIDYMTRPEIQQMPFTFVIVGDGPNRTALENKVSQLNLESCVKFTGKIPPEDIYRYYRIGDIFISASSSETQGLTYIEALACGLPLVCKKDSCLDEVLFNNYNGIQYDTPDSFIEAILNIQANEVLRKAMSNASKIIAEEYSNEVFGKKIAKLYQETLEKYHSSQFTKQTSGDIAL